MPKVYISKAILEELKQLAKGCCEYCKYLQKYSPAQFNTDHIIPLSLGGTNDLMNLARACNPCNGSKYTATTALDPITNKVVPLFHPRKEEWYTHFKWSADFLKIEGITATGRATVVRLKMNRPEIINLRRILIGNGHPPE